MYWAYFILVFIIFLNMLNFAVGFVLMRLDTVFVCLNIKFTLYLHM